MRILIVEDEKKVASFLEKGLREEGYSVDVAHDGDEGLLKAPVHEYDLHGAPRRRDRDRLGGV